MWTSIWEELQTMAGVLVAVVLGFAIGFERKLRFKEAGIRTHAVVCVGAALMMVVSKYGFGGEEADASRVAAQIVSGIGFLCAGIIVYRQHEVHGLTTAAGVWATAGVGMAAGAGLYIVAVCATVIIIAVQCLFHANIPLFRTKKYYQVIVCFENVQEESALIKEIFEVEHFNKLTIEREGDHTLYHATLNTDKEFSSGKLGLIMASNPYIRSIERVDDD